MRSVQLTLLSADRDTHDRLKGAVCFDDTVRAALRAGLADFLAREQPDVLCLQEIKATAADVDAAVAAAVDAADAFADFHFAARKLLFRHSVGSLSSEAAAKVSAG